MNQEVRVTETAPVQYQPLSGLKVIDFTQVMLGPCCTQVLADYGADVIKIERPGMGDLSRTWISDDPERLTNPIFRSLNRNKRSISLDLRQPDGKAVVYELIKTADIVVSNFRAGVIERMGFGHEQLARINERIITASGTGFGTVGPLAHKGGQDILAQALSGTMSRRSDTSVPLSIYPTAVADYTAGMHLVQAILLAVIQRHTTGRGQAVSVSLFESMLNLQIQEAAMLLQRGADLNWAAFPLTGVFETTDGAIVLVGAFKTNPLQDICRALDLPDLSAETKYKTFSDQLARRPDLQSKFKERFASNTTEHWLLRLEEQDLLCAPVLSLAEALAHEQTKANKALVGEQGMQTLGSPLTMSDGGFAFRHAAPKLGQDARVVLKEAGFSQDKIGDLITRGIIKDVSDGVSL